MMTRNSSTQQRMFLLNWEELIPKDHLLRKIDEAIDFSFIYDKVADLYSPVGRPSIDPVVLFKMLLVGYLYGIPSERRLEEEVKLNLAYRWFVGLQLDDPVPDHSTFSQNRRRRFADSNVFEDIFNHVVGVCIEKGLVTGELVVTDSTHIKANVAVGKNESTIEEPAHTPSEYLKALDAEAERLEAELNRRRGRKDDDSDQGRGGSKPRGGIKTPEPRKVKISNTDPDARLMNRSGKPGGYHYLAHQTIDSKHGIIIDVHTTPGNVNDHIPYADRLKHIVNTFGLTIKKAAADRGYDEMLVHRALKKLGIQGFIPRQTKRGPAKTFRKEQFEYDATGDFYLCPAGHKLSLKSISRTNGQKIYAGAAAVCQACPYRTECVPKSARMKHITRPLFQDAADITHRRIGTEEYKRAQKARRVWIEGTFGLQKRLHNLARARMRGLQRVREQALISALAINLKRMVKAMPQMA